MNKTININLGGYAFVIDEDAFETAHNYLNALTRHFGGSEGAAEIMSDIESRMGELVTRNKGSRSIVSKLDIVEAIAVLGSPEELKDVDFTEPIVKASTKTSSTFQLKTGKRFYRDPDDNILGGVCSGLSAYFGIQDAVWIRLIFVILTFAGGASFILYAVLWAIVPAARTVSDRLEMLGEPTNVNNIARMVKEEIEEISDKLHDKFGKKGKHFSYFNKHHSDNPDQTKTSGWSWDYHQKSGTEPTLKSKDFV